MRYPIFIGYRRTGAGRHSQAVFAVWVYNSNTERSTPAVGFAVVGVICLCFGNFGGGFALICGLSVSGVEVCE